MNTEKQIWNYFKKQGLSDAGVAGLMGNLFAESGLNPINLQNTFNKKLKFTDEAYTAAVDDGSYVDFIQDKAGYGLAQWTFWARKEKLLNRAKEKHTSIGNLQLQLNFLLEELTSGYQNLFNFLKSTNSVEDASTRFLLEFERPKDQSKRVQLKRISYSTIYYNKYFKQSKVEANIGMKYNETNRPLVCMLKNSTCYQKTNTMDIKGILWHSTGVNNPALKRYIQPYETDSNYDEMIKLLGKNYNNNDLNHIYVKKGVNAWIGKTAKGKVETVQTLPWNYRPWGCGSGNKGSCNTGWIQFEICEDNLNDKEYFDQIYQEACELTAYLCHLYNINPNGRVTVKGIKIPTILCHADSYKLGFGSNHGDVLHWFSRYGKTMNDVRKDVTDLLKTIQEDDDMMTQEQFNEMMDKWIVEQANKNPGDWSQEAREWAENKGLVQGDASGRKMYKKFITREELMVVLHRALKRLI